MQHALALNIAQALVERLSPACTRIEIAGSVRRQCPDVHDIEIVAVPKLEPRRDCFGEVVGADSQLDPLLIDIGRQEKGGDRYKKFMLPEGVCLDLFLVLEPAQWGVIYTIRTGPAAFSKWIVTPVRHGGALPSYLRVHEGQVWQGRESLPVPEEQDFFRLLGLEWMEPRDRVPIPLH